MRVRRVVARVLAARLFLGGIYGGVFTTTARRSLLTCFFVGGCQRCDTCASDALPRVHTVPTDHDVYPSCGSRSSLQNVTCAVEPSVEGSDLCDSSCCVATRSPTSRVTTSSSCCVSPCYPCSHLLLTCTWQQQAVPSWRTTCLADHLGCLL